MTEAALAHKAGLDIAAAQTAVANISATPTSGILVEKNRYVAQHTLTLVEDANYDYYYATIDIGFAITDLTLAMLSLEYLNDPTQSKMFGVASLPIVSADYPILFQATYFSSVRSALVWIEDDNRTLKIQVGGLAGAPASGLPNPILVSIVEYEVAA